MKKKARLYFFREFDLHKGNFSLYIIKKVMKDVMKNVLILQKKKGITYENIVLPSIS